jgi:cell division transport system permease protein
MISFVAFAISRAWTGFWRNAVMSVAATATMVLLLLLLAGFFLIQSGLLAGLDFVEQKVQVVADIRDTAKLEDVEALKAQIAAMPVVVEVTYVSREEALERFRQAREVQGQEDFTRFLESNPLHASLEVRLKDARSYDTVEAALRADPTVQRVKNIADLVDKVVAVTSFMRTAGAIVLGGIALIVLFIVVNTIRLAVVSRAEEIEIMRLVGASDAFIRWPFVFEGALVGLFGAALALLALGAVADPIGQVMYDFFRILPIHIGDLARQVALLVGGAGLALGAFGAWLSVRTYLIR